MSMPLAGHSRSLELVANIISAFVVNNAVPPSDLPALIQSVHGALTKLDGAPVIADAQPEPAPVPAVPVRKSLTPDYLICLEDGKKFKSMKRHLSKLGLTPDQYRAKWNLPADYPVVAPNYAARRSAMALKNGLGRKPAPVVEVEVQAKAKVGRPRKVGNAKAAP